MKTKCFKLNDNNKIEFTESELKQLLDEIYDAGYNDGKYRTYVYTTPSYPWYKYPYITCNTTTTDAKDTATSTTASSSNMTVKGTRTATYVYPKKYDTTCTCKKEEE